MVWWGAWLVCRCDLFYSPGKEVGSVSAAPLGLHDSLKTVFSGMSMGSFQNSILKSSLVKGWNENILGDFCSPELILLKGTQCVSEFLFIFNIVLSIE